MRLERNISEIRRTKKSKILNIYIVNYFNYHASLTMME